MSFIFKISAEMKAYIHDYFRLVDARRARPCARRRRSAPLLTGISGFVNKKAHECGRDEREPIAQILQKAAYGETYIFSRVTPRRNVISRRRSADSLIRDDARRQ